MLLSIFKYALFAVVFLALGIAVGQISAADLAAVAGNLDSSDPPGSTESFSLEDIYQRLETGAAGVKSAFKEPSNGPTSGTMHTLNQIMAKAPLKDDASGAQAGYVLAGKTFWGLTGAQWGPMVGTRPPAPIPRTGQVDSIVSGDDGDLKKGISWPDPRFTDNLDGTITDNLTGLVWLKDASCIHVGSVFGGSKDSWANAILNVNSLFDDESNDCSLTDGSKAGDWRLPNLRELQSLLDYSRKEPPLPSGHPFIDVKANISDGYLYWTSTKHHTANNYWTVSMEEGKIEEKPDIPTNETHFIWPVRDP